MSPRHWSLGQIADALDLRLRGDSSRVVRGVATLAKAGPDQIAFLANPRYRRALGTTRAAAVVLHAEHADARSEEHTSELQSLMRISFAVFCLKKKNKNNNI